MSKYLDGLFRVILTNGGTAVGGTGKAIKFAGGKGLDVTQAPDGTLIEARYSDNAIYAYTPVEAGTSAVAIKSIFPRRGGKAGGSTLTVHGKNLKKNGATPTVKVGGSNCAVQWASNDKLQCTLPGGSGKVDVTVNVGGESYTFSAGYRFVDGK